MKSTTVLTFSFCAALVSAAVASDSRYLPLDASYAIAGETILDPSPDEKKDRVAIYIRGDGARAIYKAMPVSEERLACDADENSPVRLKSAGGLTCSGDEKHGYTCGVAIKLDDGTTHFAVVC